MVTLLLLLSWELSVMAAAPSTAEIREALVDFNASAIFPLPSLSETQVADLAQGKVVSILLRGDQGVWRAVGLYVIPLPRRDVWIACQDAHFSNVERVTELAVARDDAAGRATWYGYVDLPAPFADRHWAVDVWNNTTLAEKTGGRAWEHPWRLNPDGLQLVRPFVQRSEVGSLTEADLDSAIYTPANEGAWAALLLPTADSTLIVYHSTTDIGGVVPDRLLAQFVLSGMEDLLQRIERRAREDVPRHYRNNHPPMRGGDNLILAPY